MNEFQVGEPSMSAIAELLQVPETEFVRWYDTEHDAETVVIDMEKNPEDLIDMTFDAIKQQTEYYRLKGDQLEEMNEYLENLPDTTEPEVSAEEFEQKLKEHEQVVFFSSLARGEIPDKLTSEQIALLDKILLDKWNNTKDERTDLLSDKAIQELRKQNLDRRAVDKIVLDEQLAPDYEQKMKEQLKRATEYDAFREQVKDEGKPWVEETEDAYDFRVIVEKEFPEVLSSPEGENYTRLRMQLKLDTPNELADLKHRGQVLYDIAAVQKHRDDEDALLEEVKNTKFREIEIEEELGLKPGEAEYYIQKMGLKPEFEDDSYKIPDSIPKIYENPDLVIVEKDRERPALLTIEEIQMLKSAGLIRPDDPVEKITAMEKELTRRGINLRAFEQAEDKLPDFLYMPEYKTVGPPEMDKMLKEGHDKENPEFDYGDAWRNRRYPMDDEHTH
jgi:hypothetical protein